MSTEPKVKQNMPHRFFDNRSKYLLFVTTSSEKAAVAARVSQELKHLDPSPPALRIFDAGMGDGTVLTKVMRDLHDRYPTIPFLVAAKEISLEDVRLGLNSMADRFAEHPQMVLVVTNMKYKEVPTLTPEEREGTRPLRRWDVALDGETAHQFDEQLRGLDNILTEGWEVETSPVTGNPLYKQPSMLVIYRKDQQFILNDVIPNDSGEPIHYDLIMAVQPFRARASAMKKVKYVLAPLARALSPKGRMIVVQSAGYDPGMELIRKIWPDEAPFKSPRHDLISTMKTVLEKDEMHLTYHSTASEEALFQYRLHALPSQMGNIGTSSLLAAWNAAIYVAQMDEDRVDTAMSTSQYLDVTRETLQQHGGLWFMNESFVVCRSEEQ